MNKIVTFVLAVSAFGLANAATEEIGTATAFKSAMENNPAGEYVLTANIDLTDAGYSSIATFSGSLDGASHTISGLGAQGLFQDCQGAVTNVTIDGTIDGTNTVRTKTGCGVFADTATDASFVGCVTKGYTLVHNVTKQGGTVGNGLIVGTAYDGCSFERCLAETGCVLDQGCTLVEKEGKLVPKAFGGNSQGGIVGLMLPKKDGVQGTFSACTNRAEISSLWSLTDGNGAGGLGGMAGYITQPETNPKTIPTVIFVDCVNEGAVIVEGDTSQTSVVGGMVGHLRGLDYQTSLRASFVNCINLGDLAATSYSDCIGGMVGYTLERVYLSIDSCVNRGTMGSYRTATAGGIVGTYQRGPEQDSLIIRNCANYGDVRSGKLIGGLLAYGNGGSYTFGVGLFQNSANYGKLYINDPTRTPPQIGELICKITNSDGKLAATIKIDNCWRKGATNAYVHIDSTCTVTETNEQTAETGAATAASELSAVARATSGYVQWGVGTNDYPELFIPGVLGPEPEPAAALSDAEAVVSKDGSTATFSVTVADTTVVGGVLKLVVNGNVRQTWTLANGGFTNELVVTRGKPCTYSFVAEETVASAYTTVTLAGEPFTPIGESNWFAVQFAKDGYKPGAEWMESEHSSGGTWSGNADETELDATTQTVSFVTTPTAPVYFTPTNKSKMNAGVTINGKMLVDDPIFSDTVPSDVPFALGFELVTNAVAFRPVAYTNGVKTAFGEATLGYNSWANFTIEGKPVTDTTWQMQVTIGTMVSDWLTVTVPNKRVSSLGYSGGSFGDMSGINELINPKAGLVIFFQ